MPSRLITAIATWRTYRRGSVPVELPIVACSPGAAPAAVAARLEASAGPLRRAGFVHALDCGPRDPATAIVNHCCVLAHPGECIRAWIMDFESEFAVHTVTELATRYADGTVVGTLNQPTPPIFDRPPWLDAAVLPGVPVDELLAVHRARAAAVAATPVAPWDEDPLVTAAHENEAVLAHQAERGILTAAEDGRHGFTGRGAARSVSRIARAE